MLALDRQGDNWRAEGPVDRHGDVLLDEGDKLAK